jgi:hypothetical protein
MGRKSSLSSQQTQHFRLHSSNRSYFKHGYKFTGTATLVMGRFGRKIVSQVVRASIRPVSLQQIKSNSPNPKEQWEKLRKFSYKNSSKHVVH